MNFLFREGRSMMKEYEIQVTFKVIAKDQFHSDKQITEFLRQVYRDYAAQYNIVDYECIRS